MGSILDNQKTPYTVEKPTKPNKEAVLKTLMENAIDDGELGYRYTYLPVSDIADELDLTRKSVTSHLNKLREDKTIDFVTKRGANGGAIVTFNLNEVEFDRHEDNPINGTTPKAEEVYEKYFKPEKYVPKRKYRPRAVVAEERIRKQLRQDKDEELNDELEFYPSIPREIFEKFEEPELAYRTYTLTRIYNALIMAYSEDLVNDAEREGDEVEFERANKIATKYRHYDVLPKRFVGTQTFKNFTTLTQMLDGAEIDALDYLDVHINYMFYLLRNKKAGRPTFSNVLISRSSFDYYDKEAYWFQKLKRKNPSFKPQGKIKHNNTGYPILTYLNKAFKGGYSDSFKQETREELDMYAGFLEDESQLAHFDDPKDLSVYRYAIEVRKEMKKVDLTEEETEAMEHFLQANLALHTTRFSLPSDVILTHFSHNIKKRGEELIKAKGNKTGNLRKLYIDYANIGSDRHLTLVDKRRLLKKGYKLFMSVNASSHIQFSISTVERNSRTGIDYNLVRSAQAKLPIQIPVTDDGFLDAIAIYNKALETSPELKEADKRMAEGLEHNYLVQMQDVGIVKNEELLWYNVYEPSVGISRRDGSAVTIETKKDPKEKESKEAEKANQKYNTKITLDKNKLSW